MFVPIRLILPNEVAIRGGLMKDFLIWCLKGVLVFTVGLFILYIYAVNGDQIAEIICPSQAENNLGSKRCYDLFLSQQ